MKKFLERWLPSQLAEGMVLGLLVVTAVSLLGWLFGQNRAALWFPSWVACNILYVLGIKLNLHFPYDQMVDITPHSRAYYILWFGILVPLWFIPTLALFAFGVVLKYGSVFLEWIWDSPK